MYPYPERTVLPDGWERASLSYGAAIADPLADAPEWVKRQIFEARQRNHAGMCWREGCGRPLADDEACAIHSSHADTTATRMEARARRLGVLTRPRTRRHW